MGQSNIKEVHAEESSRSMRVIKEFIRGIITVATLAVGFIVVKFLVYGLFSSLGRLTAGL